MLQVSIKPRKKNAGRPPEKDARGFLQWLRKRDCVFAYCGGCEGKIEAMHLDFAGGKGVGTKVADRFAVPSCSGHHSRQHTKGLGHVPSGDRRNQGGFAASSRNLLESVAWPSCLGEQAMSYCHILRTTAGWSRWRVASSWYSNVQPDTKVFTSCCSCNVRADEALVSIERVKSHMLYFEPQHRIRCRAGKGCNANPKKRRGAYLRSACHWGW